MNSDLFTISSCTWTCATHTARNVSPTWPGYKHIQRKKSLCRDEFGRLPERTASQTLASGLDDGRHSLRATLFIGPDCVFVAKCPTDAVKSFQQDANRHEPRAETQ